MRTALVLLALVLPACGPSAWETARRQDSSDSYREFVRKNPSSPSVPAARARLAELEFQEARREHSILGYKRFLERFPESLRRDDAMTLLEGLRFEAAAKADTSDAWNEFLRDHPGGARSAEARIRLDEADWKAAQAATTPAAVSLYISNHPESNHRADADRLLDERTWAEAKAAGAPGLAHYLETSPAGSHRDEARAEIAAREALVQAQMGDLELARRSVELVVDPVRRDAGKSEIDRIELQQAAALMDPDALDALASRRTGKAANEAKEASRALRRDAASAAALRLLVARLDPARFARPADELVRVLLNADPRERWLAAEELGLQGSRKALDPLLEAATSSRFSRVRERAFAALKVIFQLLPADAVEVDVRRRLGEIRRVAQNPVLHVKAAILGDLIRDPGTAEAWARAIEGDTNDLFVLRHLAAIRAARSEGFGAAVAWRELAVRVQGLVDVRTRDEGLSPLLLARTLCGARDDAQAALEGLRAMPEKVARDFPEDVPAFVRKAEETVRLVSARLADAEAEARSRDLSFKACDDDGGMHERLASEEKDRLEAVATLAGRKDPRARPALELASHREPSPRVRAAIAATLAPPGG